MSLRRPRYRPSVRVLLRFKRRANVRRDWDPFAALDRLQGAKQ